MEDSHRGLIALFSQTGLTGLAILASVLLLGAALFVSAVERPRRVLAVAGVAAALVPVALGFLGSIVSGIEAQRVIASLKAPTPRDLAAAGTQASELLLFGLMGTLVLWIPAVIAFARSRPPQEARP